MGVWRVVTISWLKGEQDAMIHEVFPVGMLACNCSILGDESTGEAVVVDPGDDAEQVQRLLKKHNLKAKYIVITHAHIDHVGGIEDLKRATGAAVMMHQDDLPLYQGLDMQAGAGMERSDPQASAMSINFSKKATSYAGAS